MTQNVCFTISGREGTLFGKWDGHSIRLNTGGFSKSGGKITKAPNPPPLCFITKVGSYVLDVALVVRAQGSAKAIITNNGHIIASWSRSIKGTVRDWGVRVGNTRTLAIEELIDITPPPIEPDPEPIEETFVFYNLYRMQTSDGGLTFQKVLTSSGKISQSDLDILLQNPDNIIEIISENEVTDPTPDNPPQNPFFFDNDGNKIYKVALTDSITIKESN